MELFFEGEGPGAEEGGGEEVQQTAVGEATPAVQQVAILQY